MFTITIGQKTKKCKLVHDKELNMEVYQSVDSVAEPINENALEDYLLSDKIIFKGISKKYPDDQMVRMAYMIGTDGKASLIKVLSPIGDKEIEQEAKRIISLFPTHKPCKCGNEAVPCNGGINIRLVPRKRIN
jgi:hypothetical protein